MNVQSDHNEVAFGIRLESDKQVPKKYYLRHEKGAKTPAVAWNIELLNYLALTPTTGIRGCFQTRTS